MIWSVEYGRDQRVIGGVMIRGFMQAQHFRRDRGRTRGASPSRVVDRRRSPGVVQRLAVATALVTLLVAGTACTSSKAKPTDSPTSSASPTSSNPSTATASPTTSATPTIDPQAQPAVDAYMAFDAGTSAAQQHPFNPVTSTPPTGADFTKYSFDPTTPTTLQFVGALAAAGEAYRGTPPTARITITAINLAAKPYPVVTLVNCPTLAPTWHAYLVKTGEQVPDQQTKAPPPNPIAVEVIQYQGHWGVRTVTPEAKTCAG